MPSVSKKQANLMQAVAHNPKFAKKVGIPVSVGKEFSAKKFQSGGDVKKDNYNFGSTKDYTLRLEGGGSGNEYGAGAGGRLTATKEIGKNTSVDVNVDGFAFKPKDEGVQGRITGAGFTLTKKFKHGGYIKSKPRGT